METMTEKFKEKRRTRLDQVERAEKKERKELQTMKEVHRLEIKHNIEKTRSVRNKLKDIGGSKPRI